MISVAELDSCMLLGGDMTHQWSCDLETLRGKISTAELDLRVGEILATECEIW